MKDKQQIELAIEVRFKPPSIEMVKTEAKKMGLPVIEAEKFWFYFSSNGWKVGRVPMKDWKMALHHWRLKCTCMNYDKPRAKTVFELKTIIEAKQKLNDELKRMFSADVAGGTQWTNESARMEFVAHKKEIRELTGQLANM